MAFFIKRTFFIFCLFFVTSVFAVTIKLKNDTTYTLKAIIKSSNGEVLKEMEIDPGKTISWDDFDRDKSAGMNTKHSITPLTVVWMLGNEKLSTCKNIRTGALVVASHCEEG